LNLLQSYSFNSFSELTSKWKFLYLFLAFFFQSFYSFSQQDCSGAIPVCQQTYIQTSSYAGPGNTQEVFNTCLANNEQASVWYVFTVQVGGTFGFNINTLNDYDWALYNLTGTSCANIPNLTPVRCNFSATYGNTGMNVANIGGASEATPAGGSPISNGLDVIAGQTYALIVDNYTQDQNGYTLTFTGNASFIDNAAPTFSSATDNCYGNYVTITLSENVTCSSIAANGSDFQITGPGTPTILSAVGVGCPGSGSTNQVQVYYNAPSSGTFTITSKVGNDGNTLLDKCGNALAVGQSRTFDHLGTVTASASPSTFCAGATVNLSVTGPTSGGTYNWSTGATTSTTTVTPSTSTTYTVTVSYGGCTRTTATSVTLAPNPVASISPQNAVVCSGATVDLTATSLVNGVSCSNCNYTWTSGPTQNGVPSSVRTGLGIGLYTVTVTTSAGCTGIASTTISGPSANPASCNVIFASPSGGGSGLSASSPTTLPLAVTMAACNNAIIKLQIGTYTLDSPLSIFSAMTIEGGYNVGYTAKTSTDGSPATTTTIFRSASNVDGLPNAGRLVAIQAFGESLFRLQDLTITTANAPAASPGSPKGVSTYGLYLSNCSNYDIVRCQILPGAASAGYIGTAGTAGTNGGNGSNGNNGSCDGSACGFFGNGNAGGAGGAGGSGAVSIGGGAGGPQTNQQQNDGTTGGTGTARNGGAGGGGGAGSDECSSNGGIGAAGGNSACKTGGTGGNRGGQGDPGTDGTNGNPGINGDPGTAGSNGSTGSMIANFWNPGGQGGTGTDGCGGSGGGGGGGGGRQTCTFCDDGPGNGAGGGGGGGQGGTGGTGGWGGGSSYALFLVSNGTNGRVVDCNVTAGTAGLGGAGGTGGAGGAGGTAGNGATNCSSEIGEGGNGGAGGQGGQGGTGGAGSPGESIGVKLVSGTALSTSITSFNLTGQPIINVSNISCTNTNLAHSTFAGSPNWSDFGANANPASGSGSPVNTQYTTTGRKTVVMSGNTYTDFNNILIAASIVTPSIITASTTICAGTAGFSSSTINQTGLTYSWTVSNPSGGSSTIANSTNGSTNITFTNTGTSNLTYTVSLSIVSSCCGTLGTVSVPIVVQANPILSAPSSVAVCLGGNTSFTSNVTGTSSNGQWQISTNGGGTWTNISNTGVYSNVTSTTLSLTGVIAGMNGYLYRYTVVGPCGTVNSTSVTLTVNTPPTATVNASPTNICAATNQSSSLTFNFTGSAPWTVTYTTNTGGSTTSTTIPNIETSPHTLTVTPTADVSYTITSVSAAGCVNTTLTGTSINVTTAAPNVELTQASYPSQCGNFNLTTLVAPPPTSTLDGPLQYASVPPTSINPLSVPTGTYTISNTNACGASTVSVSLTVIPSPSVSLPASSTICAGTSVNLTATPSQIGGTYSWSPGGQTTQTISVSPITNTTYAVSYSSPGCTPATASTTITVRPTPSAIISGTTTVCQQPSPATATIPITFTNLNADQVLVSYQINGAGSFSVGVNGNSTATVSVPIQTVGTYVYTITSVQYQSGSPNCSSAQTGSATVTVTPLPTTVSISGSVTTVCQNGASPFVIFTNPNSTDVLASYTVNGVAATPILVPANNGTATVGVNTSTSGTITYALTGVAFNTPGGCTATATGTAIFTIVPLPTVTISGTTSVCQGASSPNVTISNPQSLAVTVIYNLNGGANQTLIVNAGFSASIPVSTATTGTFTYNLVSVTLNGGAGCSASLSSSATVTVIQTPSVTISGNATVCLGATPPTVTFTNFSTTAVSVNYTIGSNPNTITIPASGTNTVTAPTTTEGNFVYTLENASYTSGNACESPVSGSITVNVLPLPTATLFGTETVCENGNATGFTISNPRPYDEQVTYTFTGGSSTTVLVPANGTYTIYPNTTPSGTFTYSLTSATYSNYSTCTSTLTGQTATLTVLPAPTVTINASNTVCQFAVTSGIVLTNNQNQDVVVTYNLNNASNTTINVSANSTATIPTTITTSLPTVYTVNVVSISFLSGAACPNPLSLTSVLTVNPPPIGSMSGAATVCQGGATNVTFTNTSNAEVVMTYALGGVNSTIIVPANGTNVAPASTATPGTYTYNLVSIAYTSGSACTQSPSGTVIVVVNPAPTATLTTSVTSVCQNANQPTVTINNPTGQAITVVYTISDGTNTTTFTENITGNSAGLFVPTNTALTYTYSIISVAYQSGGGCTNTGVTSSVTMEITAPPTITNTAVNVCSGTALNIPLTSSPSGATFTWNASAISNNNNNITGEPSNSQNTNTINSTLLLTGTTPKQAIFYVIPTLNGCSGLLDSVVVTVYPIPVVPNVSVTQQPTCAVPTGSVALSGLPAAGTWTVNGNPSGTATGTGTTGTINGLAPGTYTFTVTNAGGCPSPASTSLTIDAAPTTFTTPTVSGTGICVNENAVFTITGLPIGTTVNYTGLAAGATPASGFVTSTLSPTITVAAATSDQTLTITSITSGACTATPPAAFTIIVDGACTPFSQCTPLVYIVSGTSALSGNAFQVSVGEVNTSTGAIGTTYTSQFLSTNSLTTSGSQIQTGFLNSYNGLLAVPGLNVAVGTTTVATANGNNKAVNILSPTTSVVNRVTFNTIMNSTQFNSVIPISSTTFYAAAGAGSNSGIYYYDGSNFTQITTLSVRSIEIFNGNLYFSTGSGSVQGIYQVGTGLPTTLTTPTPLFPVSSSLDPYGFSISPDGCTMYVACMSSTANRAVSKYTKIAGVWTYSYRYNSSTNGGAGLVVDYSQTNPILYVSIGVSGPANKLVKLIDTGSAITITGGWSVTAPSNTRYSGLDFAPNLNPLITTQPTDLTACASSNSTISVVASSYAGTLSYQWYLCPSATETCGATQVAGATSATFTPPTGTGYYYCRVIVDNGTCKQYMNTKIVTTTITAPPTATLSSATFCITSSTPTSLTLTTTGDQTGATWSGGGLVGFNTTTGQFTPSASAVGPYTVTYTIPAGVCPAVVATGQVSIATSPSATISYTGSPFCSSAGTQTVNLTGDVGGTYTSTPTGLSISSLSGTITPSSSTGGTYTVTYTIPAAGGCLEVTSTASITITTAPTATISYNGPFCLSNLTAQNVNITGTAGGTFTASPSGLSINASTGAITPNTSTTGTYTVTYTLPAASGCPIFTTTASITISSLPNVTATLSSTSSCNGGTLTLTGGPAGMTSYSWTGPTGVTFSPNAFTQSPSVTMGATGGTFTLTATDAGGCTNTATTAAVTINPSPTVTVNCNPICVGGSTIISATPNPTGTYSYAWTVPSGATNPGNVQSFSTGTQGTYSVVVTNTTTTCPSIVPSSCTITVYASPSIIFLSPP
jgi:hypothetical protein